MRGLILLLAVAAGLHATTYSVTQIAFNDCFLTGCGGNIQNGDTTIFTAWASTGAQYGTMNDLNVYYNPEQNPMNPGYTGPNCSGVNVIWLEWTGTNIHTTNCMFSYGASDTNWPPATAGTCSSGYVNDCDWKSQGSICIGSNTCIMQVYRQQRAGTGAWIGHDSTLIKTTDGGLTWCNPAHCGSSTNVNGDAPAGPGDASYPASILWPDPVSHNGIDQHVARLEFVQYGQGGASWPSVDGNATYIYALAYSGNFNTWYLARVVKANIANLSASDWSYYKCPGYTTSVCDGTIGGNWDSDQANATPLGTNNFGLGGVFYSSELASYVTLGGNIGPVPFYTAPHIWGPWTISATMNENPSPNVNLGFIAAMPSTMTTISTGVIQFQAMATAYNNWGSGSPVIMTYRISSSGIAPTTNKIFPMPGTIGGPINPTTPDQTTSTQARLTYTAPDSNPCTVEVSTSAAYSPLALDVDPAYFTGAGQSTGGSGARVYVVGKRTTEMGLDSLVHSRALQANTLYYKRTTCTGPTVMTGTFTTANIPVGMTYQDLPTPLDVSIDQTDRTKSYIDPRTGLLIKPVSLPVDTGWPTHIGNLNTSGPYMYSGGMFPVCGDTLITPASGPPGFLCAFPQGAGGQGVLYFLIPSTFEARFLGFPNWAASSPNIAVQDSKFYYLDGSNNLVVTQYTGDYQPFPAFTTISTSTTTTLMTGVNAAIAAFDPRFDASGYSCGAFPIGGDYILLRCNRGSGQDVNAFAVVIQVSTASVVASAQTNVNPKSTWCAMHQMLPISRNGLIGTDLTFKTSDAAQVGGGPNTTTYTGGSISAGTQTITVAGEPTCIPFGSDPLLPPAMAGDTFRWSDNGEIDPISVKVDPTHWTVTTTSSHVNGATLTMLCMGNSLKPVFWQFLQDPFGVDSTNTWYTVDIYAPEGGHDDFKGAASVPTNQPVQLFENSGWSFRTNFTFNTPLTSTVSDSANFGGVLGQCFGDGCKKHPSAVDGQNYVVDFSGWDGAFASGATLTAISGNLYKYNPGTYPITPKQFAIAGSTGIPLSGGIHPHPFTDISAPSSVLGTGSGDNYKMCNSNVANECHTGSSVGDWYVNLPGTPSNCTANQACITNNAYSSSTVMQIGTSGTQTRALTGDLSQLRGYTGFPTARGTADGSMVLFPWNDPEQNPPAMVMMAQLPPLPAFDGTDRTTFIPAPVQLTSPGGTVTNAIIEFGYEESGTRTQYYCGSRREPCVAGTTVSPFAWPTDGTANVETGLTGTACTTTCTITIPVLPQHVVWARVLFRNSSNATVGSPVVLDPIMVR